MDPDETLARLRALAETALESGSTTTGQALAEHFQALDEWLTKGGFPPAEWRS